MAKFDQGGGCPCGLYRECDCDMSEVRKPVPSITSKTSDEDAQRIALVWRLNDERNRNIEQKKKRMQELDDIACISEGEWN